MPASTTSTTAFIDALHEAERAKDPGPLVRLFTDDCHLENAPRSASRSGTEGARQFWEEYLSTFDHIHSRFTNTLEGDHFAILEWQSDGALANTGQPLSYTGVSILEFAPDDPTHVRHFRTYYDSATFLPGGAKHAAAQAK